MSKKIAIYCENTGATKEVTPGTNLLTIAKEFKVKTKFDTLAAIVDNQLKELWFEVFSPHNVRFIDIRHPDGMRTYQRSLTYLLQKAVRDVLPNLTLIVEHSVSKGLYCELAGNGPIEITTAGTIAEHMRKLVEQDLPFEKTKIPTPEAIKIFKEQGYTEKALLQETRGRLYTSVYYLDGYPDHFYGPLVPSTGYLKNFGIIPYFQGILLMFPQANNFNLLEEVVVQKKMFDIFREHKNWVAILGARSIGQINAAIQRSQTGELIKVAEALHERKYGQTAEMISARRSSVKIVLIAGPSSSGKTTTSKRLAIQLKVSGFVPKVLELDNYFVNRELTPKDKHGEYDFESIHALDIKLFNQHLKRLLAGEEVHVPRFNFTEGKREYTNNNFMRLNEKDILIIEGIHGLNPELIASIDSSCTFKIYTSALTSVSIDNNNRISTTDNRLIRRIVRDASMRGSNATETINRWPSVRRGEDQSIFPFQENADVMFNSSLLYELNVLGRHAEYLLRQVPTSSPAYTEANRLLKFLSYFTLISPADELNIPPTSVIREFTGGSSFSYD
ncbi:MAG: nucleoside kinase [Prevotellaceae bacterium]|nr:nucleoside kinase [Prevotellaceae bacterium]